MAMTRARVTAADAKTLDAPPSSALGPRLSGEIAPIDRDGALTRKEAVSAQIRFRHALTAGASLWLAFLIIDWQVTRYLDGGRFPHFVLLRSRSHRGRAAVLRRAYRSPPPSRTLLQLST